MSLCSFLVITHWVYLIDVAGGYWRYCAVCEVLARPGTWRLSHRRPALATGADRSLRCDAIPTLPGQMKGPVSCRVINWY